MINVKLSFQIIRLTFCDLSCSRRHPKQIIICLTLSFSRSFKWLLKQVIFHNNRMGKGHKNMYDTQNDTYSRFQTYP